MQVWCFHGDLTGGRGHRSLGGQGVNVQVPGPRHRLRGLWAAHSELECRVQRV